MRKSILVVLVLSLSMSVFSQKKEKTLFTLDGEKISVTEFKRVYEKNLDIIDSEDAKDVTKNLELYIDYKLKVKEAYRIKLDTLPSYISEMSVYRNQLSKPYLKDTTYISQMVKDAYFRTKNEVKVKHILIRMSNDALPKDTLVAYNKILKIRNRILNNGDFETIAAEVSEDKSAQDDPKTGRKGNKGNLGYFSAFRMVYPFENAAYSTNVNEVSMPFKTQFGYHILKVDKFRTSKGDVKAAHILIEDTTAVGKTKIDEAYKKLINGEKYEDLAKQYSDDYRTKEKGGNLGRFSSGRMIKAFDDVVFGLQKENTYSKPFKTRFGWHIVKLLNKYPIAPFNDIKKELTDKIVKSSRMKLSDEQSIKKLGKQYKIIENEEAKKILNNKNCRSISKDSLQETIIRINDKKITQEDFVNYIKNRRNAQIADLFKKFKNIKIIEYFKENLINTEPEYAYTIKEYKDGLLLFELMQQKIWNRSTKDTLGLKKFFKENEAVYKTKELKEVKGKVMSDYQNFIEKNWIADLKRKSVIKVRKEQLKKLIKFYKNK